MVVFGRLGNLRITGRGSFRQNIIFDGIVKIVEFPLLNSLADDINVVREVHLLEDLHKEARKKRYGDGEDSYCPERRLAKCFSGRLIEIRRGAEG